MIILIFAENSSKMASLSKNVFTNNTSTAMLYINEPIATVCCINIVTFLVFFTILHINAYLLHVTSAINCYMKMSKIMQVMHHEDICPLLYKYLPFVTNKRFLPNSKTFGLFEYIL